MYPTLSEGDRAGLHRLEEQKAKDKEMRPATISNYGSMLAVLDKAVHDNGGEPLQEVTISTHGSHLVGPGNIKIHDKNGPFEYAGENFASYNMGSIVKEMMDSGHISRGSTVSFNGCNTFRDEDVKKQMQILSDQYGITLTGTNFLVSAIDKDIPSHHVVTIKPKPHDTSLMTERFLQPNELRVV
jgi:hypothetical protein